MTKPDHDDGNLRAKLDIAISALEFARDGYERIDIKHIEYRVGVYTTACDALDKIALPSISNHQPHAVSQGWRDDMENAPDNIPVLLAWQDWRDGQWCMEIGPAITGQRYANGYSSISHHGSATHWMPLPAPPSPAKTGGAS